MTAYERFGTATLSTMYCHGSPTSASEHFLHGRGDMRFAGAGKVAKLGKSGADFAIGQPLGVELLGQGDGCWHAPGIALAASHLPLASRLRSQAALSLATNRAFSSCEKTPSIWRMATFITLKPALISVEVGSPGLSIPHSISRSGR